MGHGGRAFAMIVAAALVLGGVGWGVDAVVRRVERERARPPQPYAPPPAPEPARPADDGAAEQELRQRSEGAVARLRAELAEALGEEPLRVGGDVVKPEILDAPAPVYTEIARRARIQGVVILEAEIDRAGRVVKTRVLKGLPMGLDDAAREAVAQWRFQPATRDGDPVSVFYVVTINFRLDG